MKITNSVFISGTGKRAIYLWMILSLSCINCKFKYRNFDEPEVPCDAKIRPKHTKVSTLRMELNDLRKFVQDLYQLVSIIK